MTMLNDLRHAVRMLASHPRFALLTIATLALGIGANTAIFTMVKAVLLSPLPYRDADRLLRFIEGRPNYQLNISYPNFVDWRARSRSFEELVVYNPASSVVLNDPVRGSEVVAAAYAEPHLFSFLGLPPLHGRTFSEDEARRGGPAVILISHRLWTERYARDPNIVGRSILMGERSVTIIGVLPEALTLNSVQVWMPIGWVLGPMQLDRGNHPGFNALARLRPGVTLADAQAEMTAIAKDLEALYPSTNKDMGVMVHTLMDTIVGRVRSMLWLLLGTVGIVLLVACANIANVLLTRAVSRTREVAIRVALGASRRRLLRLFLTESLVVSLAGGAAGILVAAWAIRALRSSAAAVLPRADEIAIDVDVLAFTAAIALVTSLFFGLLPALRAADAWPLTSLRAGTAAIAPGRRRLRSWLVGVEVALALVLLVGAGLMLRTMARLAAVDPGFDPANVLAVRATPPGKYSTDEDSIRLMNAMLESLRAVPAATEVAAAWPFDFTGFGWTPWVNFPDRPFPEGKEPPVVMASVTPSYFRLLGIPLVAGRFLDDRDRLGRPVVGLVNREFVRRFYPDQPAIGKRINFRGIPELSGMEIVGVVGDTLRAGLAGRVAPEVYAAWLQFPQRGATILVRGEHALPPAGAVRERIAAVDPAVALSAPRDLAEAIDRTIADRRWFSILLGMFASVAFALATIGVGAAVAYNVAQRTREMAVRLALGANPSSLVRMLVSQSVQPVAIGLTVGLGASWLLSGFIRTRLYGVTPTDPVTFGLVAALMAATAVAAAYIPARRVTSVDPLISLKTE